MPRPRANFSCLSCDGAKHELPVDAAFCPFTGGPVERLFDAVQTATGVSRPRAERRRRTVEATQRARFVDQVAAPVIEDARALAPKNYDPAFTSRPVQAGAALGMVPQENRLWSRHIAGQALPMMKAAGGPVPRPGSKDG